MMHNLLGVFIRPFSSLLPVKKRHWVFGSDFGNMYREGSKYFLEYMLTEHPEYDCVFITRDKGVIKELRKKGIPVLHNYSFKGIYKISIADCIFTTQTCGDVYFAYKKKNRCYFYLVHGQPYKVALGMLSRADIDKIWNPNHNRWLSSFRKIKARLGEYWGIGYNLDDISFVSATSSFTASLMRREFNPIVGVKILGMPRNDALFQPQRMKKEKWLKETNGKCVITYMPTHRLYGNGASSPIPFINHKEIQDWMKANDVVLLMKQHPNMVKQYASSIDSDVIIDISKMQLDPQVVIYNTDILITDHSSVWMDFLMLKRPLIFYFYDNFENDDVGCYYDLRDEFPDNCCNSESELFDMIKIGVTQRERLIPSPSTISKFHQYLDGNSCLRYYEEIKRIKYNGKWQENSL